MIHRITKERLAFIFIEGLMDPFRVMLKVSSPRILDNVIQATYDLEPTMKSLKGGQAHKGQTNRKLFVEEPSKAKPFPPPCMD